MQLLSRTDTSIVIYGVLLPSCVHSPHRLHPLLGCCQWPLLLTLSGAKLMRWDVAELLSVHAIDDFDVLSDLAFDTLVSLSPHLSLLIELNTSLFDVGNGASYDLYLLVLFKLLVDKDMPVARGETFGLGLFAQLELLALNTIIHRLLLLKQDLGTVFYHAGRSLTKQCFIFATNNIE